MHCYFVNFVAKMIAVLAIYSLMLAPLYCFDMTWTFGLGIFYFLLFKLYKMLQAYLLNSLERAIFPGNPVLFY